MIVSIWQEYEEQTENSGLLTLFSSTSTDGLNWTSKVRVTTPFQTTWDQKVSLFSFVLDSNGQIHVALLENEKTISHFRSQDSGVTYEKIDEITSDKTLVAPRLYIKENNGLILFATRENELTGDIITTFPTIYSVESSDGLNWGELELFVSNPDLLQSFLPYYESWDGSEYVVFQAISTNRNFQLFIKSREQGSINWSEARLLTGFLDPETPDTSFEGFTNQRPYLMAADDHLSLVWERNREGFSSRIYYAQLFDASGDLFSVEAVTNNINVSAYPRLEMHQGEEILLWFDNRNGNKIVLGQKEGFRWDEKIVSTIDGDSTYGQIVKFTSDKGEEELLIAWENVSGNRNRNIILSPDQTVNQPRISAVNFSAGIRSKEELPSFSWTEPSDSSLIRGYSYIWTRDLTETPPQSLDRRGDSLRRRATFQAREEGIWYFILIAQDYASNWSEPEYLSFHYDITPPQEVVFYETKTDPFGYALSNSFELLWEDPPDEDINRYFYSIDYLGSELFDSSYRRLAYTTPSTRVNLNKSVSISNLDNGYWGITVIAEDTAGNRSKPSIQIFRLRNYIPVTFITNVTSTVDDLLRIKLRIRGKGFATQGEVSSVIIDSDARPPWDLQYFLENDEYSVIDNRTITGPRIDDIQEGIYHIAVEHPERGIVFARRQLKFESTGVVKFGDYKTDYKSIWNVIPYEVRTVPGNLILALSVIFLLALIITISAFKMIQIGKEIKELEYNSKALFEGRLLSEELRKEQLKTMKRKGFGLRIKFLMALLSLVISVILMISISLGFYMIDLQKKTLADGMEQRGELLLETLVSGAENALQLSGFNRSLSLNAIPDQKSAMDEALYATISGLGRDDQGVYDYIWAHNDENIKGKFKLPQSLSQDQVDAFESFYSEEEIVKFNSIYEQEDKRYNLNDEVELEKKIELSQLLSSPGLNIIPDYTLGGITRIEDEISLELIEKQNIINENGKEIIGDIPGQISELQREINVVLETGGTEEQITEITNSISQLNELLNDGLSEIGNQSFIYPEFIPEDINRDQLNYIFYHPIVYQDSTVETYYRGTVRLGVSVELILDQIDRTITQLIQITILISLAALALGVVGALILASTMINPIKKLVAGVERIRDAQDITSLSGEVINVKSKDELYDLAETVNQMTSGLIKAAVASKQVTLGAEIQKKFVRLEPVPGEDRKLPTGSTFGDNADFYGYYRGAKEVSGDYFNYHQIDDEHYACIKCDISGKDIPASLLMVVVATVFDNYCKNLNLKRDGIHLNKMVEDVNDLYDQLNFQGKFAAFTIILINIKTGKTWMSNAGDNVLHYFDGSKREMDSLTLHKSPAAGPFPTDLVNMQGGFKQETHRFQREDILFLFTDGIEESQRDLRNTDLEIIECEGCDFAGVEGAKENRDTDTHVIGAKVEELGLVRIDQILNSILNGQNYEMVHNHNPFPDKKLTFDFTGCDDSLEDGVIGLLSVDVVYRLFPDPDAGPNDKILVYRKFDEFLRKHFDQYDEYFHHPMDHPDSPEYMFYTHIKETKQYDDTTILAIRLK